MIFAATLLMHGLMVRHGDLTPDESLHVFVADRILRGEIPHADFLSLYPIGHYLPSTLAMAIGGGGLWAERLSWVVLRAITAVVLWRLADSAGHRPAGVVAAIAFALAPGAPHKVFYILVPATVALALVDRLREGHGSVTLAGVAIGLGAWFRQDVAVASAIAAVVTLGFSRGDRRDAGRLVVMAFLAGSVGFVALAPWVSPISVARQVVMEALQEGLPEPVRAVKAAEQSLLLAVVNTIVAISTPLVALMLVVVGWRRRQSERGGLMLFVGLWALITCNQVFREGTLYRFVQIAPPIYVGLAAWFSTSSLRGGAWSMVVISALTGVVSCLMYKVDPTYAGSPARLMLTEQLRVRDMVIFGTRARIEPMRKMAQTVERMVPMTDKLFVLNRLWSTYVLTGRQNSSRVLRLRPGDPVRAELLARDIDDARFEWLLADKEDEEITQKLRGLGVLLHGRKDTDDYTLYKVSR